MGFKAGAAEGKIFMTDPSITPDMPDAIAIAHFLRRFADLMSNGQNAAYLHHAAVLLETLTAQLTAASDEENLWRYKYETVTRHADALEAECDGFKHDIEGHVAITTSILAERDLLKSALQARETELAELRAAFDRERKELEITVEKSAEELREFRLASEREREELKMTVEGEKQSLAELRVAFDRERGGLHSQLEAREDELAALRAASRRDNDELKAKVATLEAKRAELRAAFDRISDLRKQAVEPKGGASRVIPGKPALEMGADLLPAQWGERGPAVEEANATVPKTTLRQARAQFEYLARECDRRGDIASQVMCELGAYILDLALSARGKTDQWPVSAVALNILTSPGSTPAGIAKTM
jgi:DNA repair exonuclease SbcCD ATPase subunit